MNRERINRARINRQALEMAIHALGMTIEQACDKSHVDKSEFYKYKREGSMPISVIAKLNEGTGIDPISYVPEAAIFADRKRKALGVVI